MLVCRLWSKLGQALVFIPTCCWQLAEQVKHGLQESCCAFQLNGMPLEASFTCCKLHLAALVFCQSMLLAVGCLQC
jgi:hypothetical protein